MLPSRYWSAFSGVMCRTNSWRPTGAWCAADDEDSHSMLTGGWWFVKSNCIQFVIDNDINQYIIVRIMIVKASFDKKQWEWSSLCKHGIWNMIVWTAAIWLHNALHATASPWDDDPQERREPSKCRHRGIRKRMPSWGRSYDDESVNGNFRILNGRYLPYIRPI